MNTNGIVAGTLVAAALLAGCGGGSSSVSTPPPSAMSTLEGLYQGTVSDGSEQTTLVLENGQFYSVYGATVGGIFYGYGMVQGSGNATASSFSSADLKDFSRDGSATAAALSASFTPNVSFNGSISEDTASFDFTSAPLSASLYNYKTAANLADIAGAWTMTNTQGDPVVLNVTSTGTLTGSTTIGCSFSGTIQPRPSGKNVFNVSLTFGDAPCSLPGQSASGIGVAFALAGGQHEFLIAGTDWTRTNGTAFAGTR